MLLPHPEVLSVLTESRLESVRRDLSRTSEQTRLRRRAGAWLVSAGFKLAPELKPSR